MVLDYGENQGERVRLPDRPYHQVPGIQGSLKNGPKAYKLLRLLSIPISRWSSRARPILRKQTYKHNESELAR
jgi:hypothetical protein